MRVVMEVVCGHWCPTCLRDFGARASRGEPQPQVGAWGLTLLCEFSLRVISRVFVSRIVKRRQSHPAAHSSPATDTENLMLT